MLGNPAHSHCILVVEDDADVRESLAEVLRDEGYFVATAGNGLEALLWLRRNHPPCLILLDLWMPVMNGEDFRAAQLGEPSLARIPVVVVSAASDAHRRATALGAAGCLGKPVPFDALVVTASQHCDAASPPC